MRGVLAELAWAEQKPDLAHLLRREDVPRLPQRLPRPLTAEQDELLQQEFLRRNDLGANAFLLMRHTGMRIGECADLRCDCLRCTAPDRWAIHVPPGKLKTERMVPVDQFVGQLVQRLRFFRSLDSLPPDGLLLARPHHKEALVRQLRDYLHQVCHSLGLPTRIVPHQIRHTYATEMIRLGDQFPRSNEIARAPLVRHDHALCGHRLDGSPAGVPSGPLCNLAIWYHNRQRPVFQFASTRLPGVIDSVLAVQHLLEMFRRSLSAEGPCRHVERIARRLTKIVSDLRRLDSNEMK